MLSEVKCNSFHVFHIIHPNYCIPHNLLKSCKVIKLDNFLSREINTVKVSLPGIYTRHAGIYRILIEVSRINIYPSLFACGLYGNGKRTVRVWLETGTPPVAERILFGC
jgi:hypothetical protein